MLNGLKHSILKQRLRRNRIVMSKSRQIFEKTLKLMAEWTQRRDTIEISAILNWYIQNGDLKLDKNDFDYLRGYFI